MSDISGRVSDWLVELLNVFCEYEKDGEIKVRRVRDEIEAYQMWWNKDRNVGRFENETANVSTAFVGVPFGDSHPPLLYETLACDTSADRKWRYASRKEAKAKHDEIVKLLEAGILLQEIE